MIIMPVILFSGSKGTAGTASITGLTSGKKYKVTTGGFTFPVLANGTLGIPGASVAYADLAALSGTSITGLTDGIAYYVQEVTSQAIVSGAAPVNEITFGVNMSGRTGSTSTVVKDAESLSIAIDNNVEEWNPMDQGGWARRLMTAKSLSISMGGKRNYGDPGCDYVAGLAWKKGQECNSIFYINFPNGDALVMPCVINVTTMGGDSTAVDALEWEALSDGKPTYTPYAG
jgi:hypothetical protein